MERTYKTSEMIAMLEKNPNLRFKARNWADASVITFLDKRLSIVDSWNGNRLLDETVLDCFRLHYDWQLVRTPVTWQEALQAWVDGKTVKCYYPENEKGIISKTFYPSCIGPTREALLTGTWYIEDCAND